MLELNKGDCTPIDPDDWVYLKMPINSGGVTLVARSKLNPAIFLSEGTVRNVTVKSKLGSVDGVNQLEMFDGSAT